MKVIVLALLLSFIAAAAFAVSSACTQPSPSNTIIDYTGLPSNCTPLSATPCQTSDTIFFSAVPSGYSFGCESHNFFWNFGDTTIGSGINVMHTFPGPGTYVVTLNLTSPFSSTTLTRTITLFTVLPAVDRRALIALALAMVAIAFVRLR
jgi:PKD repeat protein